MCFKQSSSLMEARKTFGHEMCVDMHGRGPRIVGVHNRQRYRLAHWAITAVPSELPTSHSGCCRNKMLSFTTLCGTVRYRIHKSIRVFHASCIVMGKRTSLISPRPAKLNVRNGRPPDFLYLSLSSDAC